jgi:transposase
MSIRYVLDMNLLNDSDWLVHSKEETPAEITVSATYQPIPACCPHCGVIEKPLKHGVQEQRYRDAPSFGKHVLIQAFRQRYRCRSCKRTFLQPLPVDEDRRMTKRCVQFIESRCLNQTFTALALEVGVVEGTVRNVFHAYIARMKETVTTITPEWLGIDELWLLRKPRAIITNVKENTLIDILADREKTTIQRYLQLMPDRSRIEVVTMDMWKPYRDAVRVILPDADVVVDKFHVVKMANYSVDQMRKELREGMDEKARKQLMRDRRLLFKRKAKLTPMQELTLETWLGNMPRLKAAYDAKEAFYDLWDAETSELFISRYAEWRDSMNPDLHRVFKELLTAVSNWENEIAAYFTHRATNAYTEALNGLVKIANRTGRGYSFDVIRAKMLYTVRKAPVVKEVEAPVIVKEEPAKIHIFLSHNRATLGVDLEELLSYFTDHGSTLEDINMYPDKVDDSTD